MRARIVLFCGLLAAVVVGTPGCQLHHSAKLPPEQMLMEPGPGVGGPGPGVMMQDLPAPATMGISQVALLSPAGMWVKWDASGQGMFDSEPLVAPGRQNFRQGGIYRLKLTNLPGRPGVELYPTLEIAPTLPKTEAYLAHNYIPVQFTEEDLNQVQSGNFVTKVIYLPDPQHQELAQAGIETLVSTRLEPGVDPIVEADRLGSILCIVRVGNKDLESPGGARQAGYSPPGAEDAAPGTYMPQPLLGLNPGYVAGVTAPQYGMPITGTPIGLPGPPHVPLGVPAGLQQYAIVNHTAVHMPYPNRTVRVDVTEHPGYSYPKPVHHVEIDEHTEAGHRSWWENFRDSCGL